MLYRFADFLLDSELGSLTGPNGPVHLRPQAFRLLEVLVADAPRILSVDEIVDQVWGVEHVSTTSIRQVVSEVRQALGDSATRSEILDTVHRRGYRLVAPVERLDSATDAPAAVVPESVAGAPEPASIPEPVASPEPTPAASTPRRWPLGVGALATLLTVVAVSSWLGATWPTSEPDAPVADIQQPRLAILGLDNLTGDEDYGWLDLAVRDLLRGELAIPGTCRLINDEDVARIREEVGATAGRGGAAATLRRLAETTGADIVLHGSYVMADPEDEMLFLLQVQDAANGEILGLAREPGSRGELPTVVRRLARTVLAIAVQEGRLGDRRLLAQGHLASSTESLKLFADAVTAVQQLDYPAARSSLERAVEIDPANPLHHDLLAAVYRYLGLDSLARQSVERASRLITRLPEEHQLSVTARVAEIEGRWSDAEHSLHTLSLRFPKEPGYSFRLARALFFQGRLEPALQTIRRSRKQSSGHDNHPRLDLLEADILTGQYQFEQAEQILSTSGGTAVEGWARLFRIYLKSGRLDDAESVLEQMEAASSMTDNRRLDVAITSCRASLYEKQGRFAESRAAYRASIRDFNALGDRDAASSRMNQLAFLLGSLGEIETAIELLEDAVRIHREARDQRRLAVSLCLAARAYAQVGRVDEARRHVREASEWSETTDDLQRMSLCRRASAAVFLAENRPDEAEARYRGALDLSLDIADIWGVSEAYHGLGVVVWRAGRLLQARTYFARAADGFEETARLPGYLDSLHAMAELELEAGDPQKARRLFEEVLQNASAWSLESFQARAREGLAKVAEKPPTRLAGGTPAAEASTDPARP